MESPSTFLVDTGAQISLIKKGMLASHVSINPEITFTLSGIAHSESFQSLGQAIVIIQVGAAYILQTFQVIADNFPLKYPGILGADFCKENGVSLDFQDNKLKITEFQHPIQINERSIQNPSPNTPPSTPNKTQDFDFKNYPLSAVKNESKNQNIGDVVTIKARTQQIIKIHALENKIGVIENNSIKLPEGIFIPNTIIESKNNEAFIPILNINENDVTIQRPSVSLQTLDNYELQENNNHKSSDRISKLIQSLRFDHLNDEEKKNLIPLIEEFNDVFSLPDEKLDAANFEPFEIELSDPKPVNIKQFRLPEFQKKIVNKQVSEMLNEGIIRESTSPFNTPMFVIRKKNPNTKIDSSNINTADWRVVFDFRALNKQTVPQEYPIPLISEILDSLGHCRYFSLLDARSAYHQCEIKESDRFKTAFSTTTGKYEFNRIPFGLRNAPSAFQRRMAALLSGLQGLAAFAYFDDIAVGSPDLPTHIARLRKVFMRLRQVGLKLKPSKTEFLQKEITFLGHVISENQVKPEESKLKAVKEFPAPKDPKMIKSFLGLIGYFRRFIDNFALTALPLTRLLRKNEPFNWTSEQQNAFETLKEKLLSQPILQIFDPNQQLNVSTDASNYAIACTLTQGPLGEDLPVAYFSRVLNKAEINYSTVEKELLAITYALKMLRPYILGIKFNIITDSRPLSYLFSIKDPTSRLMRMRLLLEEYNYTIIHRSGVKNTVCDALSRYPPTQTENRSQEDNDGDITTLAINKLNQVQDYNTFLEAIQKSVIVNNLIKEHPGQSPPSMKNKILFVSIDDEFMSPPFDNATLDQIQNILRAKPDIGDVHQLKIEDENYYLLFTSSDYSKNNIVTVFDAFVNLRKILEQQKIFEISIRRKELRGLDYEKIRTALRYVFKGSSIKVDIYFDNIIYPERKDIPQILKENHDSITAGHAGFFKTYERINKKYHWGTMKKDLKNYIKGCDSCQRNKKMQKKPKSPMPITSNANRAFEKIYLDIIERYPITERGNTVALTIQDDLTKFSLAIPLPDHQAETVANALVYQFIVHYGTPKQLITDCGKEFVSELLKKVAKTFHMKNIQTLPYRPTGKAALERVHSTFQDFVKHYVDQQKQSDWDLLLPLAAFSYNSSIHTGTKFTPFELVFGHNPETPVQNSAPPPQYNYDDYVSSLKHRLYAAQQMAKENLQEAKIKSKIQYDKNSREVNYKIGDKVYLEIKVTPKGLATKFRSRYEGPYSVTEIHKGNTVTIKRKNSEIRVHKDRIKPARSQDFPVDSNT